MFVLYYFVLALAGILLCVYFDLKLYFNNVRYIFFICLITLGIRNFLVFLSCYRCGIHEPTDSKDAMLLMFELKFCCLIHMQPSSREGDTKYNKQLLTHHPQRKQWAKHTIESRRLNENRRTNERAREQSERTEHIEQEPWGELNFRHQMSEPLHARSCTCCANQMEEAKKTLYRWITAISW